MSTTDGRAQLLTLFLAGSAVILALLSWLTRDPARVPGVPSLGSREVEELRSTQADLARRIEELEARLNTMRGSAPDVRRPVPPSSSWLIGQSNSAGRTCLI